jgi:transposase
MLEKLRLNKIENVIILMDNVAFHRCLEIRQIINDSGNVLMLLPPYSPFLNPIENLFSKWKQCVLQSRPINEEHLLNLIEIASNFINREDCEEFYRHMLGFLVRCIEKKPIVEEQ